MIRFLAEADLNDAIVSGCLRREPAMDFLSAKDAILEGVPDLRLLALAAEQDRILVLHDFQTMPRHFGEFLRPTRTGAIENDFHFIAVLGAFLGDGQRIEDATQRLVPAFWITEYYKGNFHTLFISIFR